MSTSTPEPLPAPVGEDLRALADEWGLTSSSARQPIRSYIRELWTRRDFIISMASSRNTAQYSDTVLGRFWQVLAPILNAIVYSRLGVLLNTQGDRQLRGPAWWPACSPSPTPSGRSQAAPRRSRTTAR